jgi:uncharacterized protein
MLKASRFNFWATFAPSRHLLLNGRTGALYELDDEERLLAHAVLDDRAAPSSSPRDALLTALEVGGFLIPDSLDEVGAMVAANVSECAAHRSLDLVVVPTYECNLRCTYCYVDFRKGRMTRAVENAVVRFVERQLHAFADIKLTWFGGEPLLCTETVLRVSDEVGRVAGAAMVPWCGMITTNGFLLDRATTARLRSAGIRYFHVTVDGASALHDRSRPTAGGRGTYARIMDNLVELLGEVSDAHVTLRMNASDGNVDSLTEVLDTVPVSYRSRVQVNVTPVRGGTTPPSAALRTKIHQVVRLALENGYLGYEAPLPVGRTTFCAADKRRNFQIGPDGTLYKCSPAVTKPEVRVGRLDAGGEPHFDDRYATWHAAPIVDDRCRECRFLCFCAGGCRVERLRRSDDLSCRDEFVDLEGLIVNHYLSRVKPVQSPSA